MYDRKVVRRRRAALAVFVALSIALLTAYFGESGGGVFHSLQRGAQEAFAPVETGANRAVKPLRDFFGWAGDTIDAKDQNKKLKSEVEDLRTRLAKAEVENRDSGQLAALTALRRENYFPNATAPVTNVGWCHWPSATVAATVAIWSGLAVIRPWPKASAARSARSEGGGTRLVTAGMPGAGSRPKPNRAAVATSSSPSRRLAACCTKAVLQELAKALEKGILPSSSSSKLPKVRPPTWASLGQSTGSPGRSPPASRAAAVTTLKVDPGG